MRFHELGLAEPIVRAVAAEGYTTPTPIQKKAIPAVLAGRDVLGCAQTGTGKTAAFAMPILHRLAAADSGRRGRPSGNSHNNNRSNPRGVAPRALVLCPTRELATQIFESFNAYGRHLPLRHVVVFGGVSQAGQERRMRGGMDVLVATPGRLLDLLNQGVIDLSAVEILVLDEADHMLDMGFIRDIRKIVAQVPAKRQTLLFSATMPQEIRGLADSILSDPVSVQAGPVATPAEAVSQQVYLVARKNKPELLQRLLRGEDMQRTLIFTRTKHGADKLVKVLLRAGINAGAIHGNKNQNARTRALEGFKSGKMRVLVATDIAARGIDVDEITHVVNFDMPNVPETYIHRIGRTARAGASGISLSFCDHEEFDHLRAIERLLTRKLDVVEHDPEFALEAPVTPRRQQGRRQGSRQQSAQRNAAKPAATPRRRQGRSRTRRSNHSAA